MKADVKFSFKNFKWFIFSFGFLFVLFFTPHLTFASTLYLAPGSGNIYLGDTKSVSVVLNTQGESVNAVSAFLSYPQDKLDVVSVSPTGAFGIQAENAYGGGIIKISRGNFSGVSGSVTVATIRFKGKTAGSATVAFIGGSQAPRTSDSTDSLNLGRSGGGVFTVGGTAPAKPAATPKSGSASTSLSISDLKVTSVSTDSATISWQTNENADTVVDYGLDNNRYFLSVAGKELVKDHVVKLESPLFVPGLLLHFRATSNNDSGTVSSVDTTLQLPGYNAKVTVTDSTGRPVAGVNVTLYSNPVQGVTDQNGEVSFQNITAGKHVVRVFGKGAEKSFEIEVKENAPLITPQVFGVQIDIPQASLPAQNLPGQITLVYFGVLVGVAIVVFLFFALRKRKSSDHFGSMPLSIPKPQANTQTPTKDDQQGRIS
ncbi:carboxypeptidase regulatory-like domain-containing protein [Patescibacteria group bacterium]|nr:carboxypeptidase regulatory-like domain-containing protein [Patescibacteria group bacterium]